MAGSIGGGGSHEHFVRCLEPDGLLYHPALEKTSGQGMSVLFQHVPNIESGSIGVFTTDLQVSESAVVLGLEGNPEGAGLGGEVIIR